MSFELHASEMPEPAKRSAQVTASDPPPVVVKVGGSLLDMPHLSDRLREFLLSLAGEPLVLVVGGGAAANLVRQRYRLDRLEDEQAHWLAVQAMTFNSFLIEALLPNSAVVTSLEQCQSLWSVGHIPIIDPHAFLMTDEASGSTPLPRTWSVTSDTIAARVANVCQARQIVLLKSVSWPEDGTLESAVRQGVIDENFPIEVRRSDALHVRIVNLRA